MRKGGNTFYKRTCTKSLWTLCTLFYCHQVLWIATPQGRSASWSLVVPHNSKKKPKWIVLLVKSFTDKEDCTAIPSIMPEQNWDELVSTKQLDKEKHRGHNTKSSICSIQWQCLFLLYKVHINMSRINVFSWHLNHWMFCHFCFCFCRKPRALGEIVLCQFLAFPEIVVLLGWLFPEDSTDCKLLTILTEKMVLIVIFSLALDHCDILLLIYLSRSHLSCVTEQWVSERIGWSVRGGEDALLHWQQWSPSAPLECQVTVALSAG